MNLRENRDGGRPPKEEEKGKEEKKSRERGTKDEAAKAIHTQELQVTSEPVRMS